MYRVLSLHLIRKAGYTRKTARTGAVTLIQRFGSALNLNVHFHILMMDGVYADNGHGKKRFYRVKAPTGQEIRELVENIARRVGSLLEKRDVLTRDAENSWLTLDEAEEDPMLHLVGSSVNYRIAVGLNQGKKVFSLQTLPQRKERWQESGQLAKVSGFSLHAGVYAEGHQHEKREHLCRYITRSAVSEKRLSITLNGQIRYQLKTPYRDGTTYVVFDPLDFIARLSALIPKPGVNLTRYHGVFAPNSADRGLITPGRRGRGGEKSRLCEQGTEKSPEERRRGMSWSQRLKRVFKIDVEKCEECGGRARIIACIEDRVLIRRILSHLQQKASQSGDAGPDLIEGEYLPPGRAPPFWETGVGLFD